MRKIIAFLLAMLLLFSLVGCGDDAPEMPEPEEPVKTEAPVKTGETVSEKTEATPAPEKNEDQGVKKAPAEPEPAPENIVKKSGPREKDFYGCWKYDEYPYYIIVFEDGHWCEVDEDGEEQIRGEFFLADDGLVLNNSDGDAILGLIPDDGGLVDTDGDTLTASLIPGEKILPSKYDPLTETITFAEAPITLSYPATMTGEPHSSAHKTLSFCAVNEDGTDDYWTNVFVQLATINGYDPYMTKGYDTAKHYMEHMLKGLAATVYPDKVLSCEMNSFEDGGTYWKVTGFAWLDNSVFPGYDGDAPILGVFDLRYIGPTGYAMLTVASAISTRVETYAALAERIADSAQFNTGFTTAVKKAPAAPGTKIDGSDPGDYGTPYYWYDEDGDVWYWNGWDNEFIGFGDDYYIDDDGEYYESNDAGWDYEDWDDYYEANDYGWGEDYYNEWSDPGDTWDWDDYYEANDYGWGVDYYNEWSDPGDYWW